MHPDNLLNRERGRLSHLRAKVFFACYPLGWEYAYHLALNTSIAGPPAARPHPMGMGMCGGPTHTPLPPQDLPGRSPDPYPPSLIAVTPPYHRGPLSQIQLNIPLVTAALVRRRGLQGPRCRGWPVRLDGPSLRGWSQRRHPIQARARGLPLT